MKTHILIVLAILYNVNLLFCSYINLVINSINNFNSKNASTFSTVNNFYNILINFFNNSNKTKKFIYAYI